MLPFTQVRKGKSSSSSGRYLNRNARKKRPFAPPANGSDAAAIDYEEDIINHKQPRVFLEPIFPIHHHLMSHELILLQPPKQILKENHGTNPSNQNSNRPTYRDCLIDI